MKDYHKVETKDNMKNLDPTHAEISTGDQQVRVKRKRVVTAQVTKSKGGLFRRLGRGLVGPDSGRRIREYVMEDIIVPAFKNIIADSVTSSINMALFGETRPPRGGVHKVTDSKGYAPSTNYSKAFGNTSSEVRTIRTNRFADEFIIPSRAEAAEVMVTLKDIADNYGSVSVADYYEMVGNDTKHTDHNYGWTLDTINRASIVQTRGGYIIKFPALDTL